jgi:hypothetical protein
MPKRMKKPSNLLIQALNRLKRQNAAIVFGQYYQSEHLAMVRYMTAEACKEKKCPLSRKQEKTIKELFAKEYGFIGQTWYARKVLLANNLIKSE